MNLKNSIKGIVFHPTKEILISFGNSPIITFSNSNNLNQIKSLVTSNSKNHTLTISNDGKYMLVAGVNIEIWDLENNKKLHTIKTSSRINTLAFSSDNKFIASAGEGEYINIWNTKTGYKHTSLKNKNSEGTVSVLFVNGDVLLMSVSKENKIDKWLLTDSKKIKDENYAFSIGDRGEIQQVKLSEKYLIFALTQIEKKHLVPTWTHKILFKKRHSNELNSLELLHDNTITSFDVSKDFQFLVSASKDKSIRLWDLKNEVLVKKIVLQKLIKDIIISHDNKYIAVLEGKNTLKTWKSQSFLSSDRKSNNRYAIVVAIDTYKNYEKYPTLYNAVADAKVTEKLLKDKGFNVKFLKDEEATRENILSVISNIQKSTNNKSSILFYFSGHGEALTLKDPTGNSIREGYILPYDFDSAIAKSTLNANYYDNNAISIASLVKYLMLTKTKEKGLLLDSCFSGLAIEAYPLAQSVNILTAGKAVPVSDGSTHSPFTGSLNKKLKKHPKECSLIFNTLAKHVSEAVKKETSNRQEPQYKQGEKFCF